MNYSTYRASLDIHASGSQAVLHAKKGETKRRILITLTERGKPYLISADCTAVFTATKPDGNIIYNDCVIDNNIICYNFTEQTTAAEGKLDCEIRLYGADNALIISPGFDLIVDAPVYEDGDVIESGTEVSALTALVSETNTLINTVNTKLENGEFNGSAGEAGGFYTPAVTQPNANTMRLSFSPSKVGMPTVAETDITLPSGGGGEGSSIAIDETLTKSGQAADAKTVGDRLDSLSEEIVTTSESKVAAHNTGTDTHSDIRLLIQGLTDRLNALADSDDTTLDQLSEVVAYIKSNRSLIEAITTSKVSVADIVDNLTTNASDKPLSAAQGVALKALIDAISVPDKLPNPNALTFTGAVTGSYDGSEALTVEIPQGGGSEWQTILTGETTVEAVTTVTIPLTASDFDEYRAVIVVGKNTDGTATNNNTNIWIDGYCCAYYMLSINYGNYVGTFSISVEPIPETRVLNNNGTYTSCAKKSNVDWWMTFPHTGGTSGTKAIFCSNTSPTGVLQIKFGTAYSGTIIHEVMAR